MKVPSGLVLIGFVATVCGYAGSAKIDIISAEIKKAGDIIVRQDFAAALSDPYIVSAIYYHPGFLSQFSSASKDQHPCRLIVAAIKKNVDREFADKFVGYITDLGLQGYRAGQSRPVIMASPLIGGVHKDAIDVFVREGSQALSMVSGIVVLAERGWDARNFLSTSSSKGGNTVIVFDSLTKEFVRYCHLAAVTVKTGQLVSAGDVVGSVGHSGTNASRGGHGRHLHVEINSWKPALHETVPLTRSQIKVRVK